MALFNVTQGGMDKPVWPIGHVCLHAGTWDGQTGLSMAPANVPIPFPARSGSLKLHHKRRESNARPADFRFLMIESNRITHNKTIDYDYDYDNEHEHEHEHEGVRRSLLFPLDQDGP